MQPIIDRSEIYSGVYARVSISLYAFSVNGNKGVACGLGNIQKIRDGEPLGGHTNASNDFDAVDGWRRGFPELIRKSQGGGAVCHPFLSVGVYM